jgi:hypothetical protein
MNRFSKQVRKEKSIFFTLNSCQLLWTKGNKLSRASRFFFSVAKRNTKMLALQKNISESGLKEDKAS